jgi:cobalt-zinc-cadmium efflux system outer membrane protein
MFGSALVRSILVGFVGAFLLTKPIVAAPKTSAPGATVTELIALARQLSPELAAAALSAEAATARIVSAGALADPTLRVDADNLDSRNVSMNGQTTTFRLMQEFPLWGKLDLKREMASFEATAAKYRSRGVEFELIARVKGVFAARYATFRAYVLTQRTLETVSNAASTMRDRYTQGGATQEDVLRIEIEGEELRIELERLRGQQTKTAAQINALLNRRPDAPLAQPAALRPLPAEKTLNVAALLDRAIRQNPMIAEGQAKAASATAGQRLAERNRYPDVSLGMMTTRDRDGYAGSGVMGELRVPLQWGAKEAEIAAASAERAAAEQRLNTLRATLGGELGSMLAEYWATAKTLEIMQQHHLPKSEEVVRATLATLESGQGDSLRVLDAIHRLQNVQLEILRNQVQQQSLLAEIEKAIGGDL